MMDLIYFYLFMFYFLVNIVTFWSTFSTLVSFEVTQFWQAILQFNVNKWL